MGSGPSGVCQASSRTTLCCHPQPDGTPRRSRMTTRAEELTVRTRQLVARPIRNLVAVVLFCTLQTLLIASGQASSSLTGTVVDTTGGVLGNMTISLEGDSEVRTATSDQNGRFRIE